MAPTRPCWIEAPPVAPRLVYGKAKDYGMVKFSTSSSSFSFRVDCREIQVTDYRINGRRNQSVRRKTLLSSNSGLRIADQKHLNSHRGAEFPSYSGRQCGWIPPMVNLDCTCQLKDTGGSQPTTQPDALRIRESGEHADWSPGRRALIGSFGAILTSGALLKAGVANAVEAEKSTGRTGPVSWLLGDMDVNSLKLGDKGPQSRVYDAAALGLPVVVSDKDKSRVWERLLRSRVIYLGEAESVPDPGDKVLELEIVRQLKEFCVEAQRPIFLTFDAFPRSMQTTLNAYFKRELTDVELKAAVPHWPPGRFEEYLSLLTYCRDQGVRLVAGGTPSEVLRTVQAGGIQALSELDRRKYAPPLGGNYSGLLFPDVHGWSPMAGLESPRASAVQGPGPYHFAQARVLSDHTMAVAVNEALASGGPGAIVVVITGASHVLYGTRGSGIPVRMAAGKLTKQQQTVILLNRERQQLRQEGDAPEGDFIWYSADKACTQNCFNRAEVARVMSAAGRTRDALPQDIQAGIDLGLVSPDVLRTFFELDQYPILAAAADRFQGLRERWLADPRFLQRLCIEEAISITTTLLAQYRKRGERFWEELEYVITDTARGAVVDFFTVWLPAPTLSFRNVGVDGGARAAGEGGLWQTLLMNLPDNAFQRAAVGQTWSPAQRLLAVVAAGAKLFAVGTVSSLGTVGITNAIVNVRQQLDPKLLRRDAVKRSPVLKTALVYGSFLATSSNLRYQMIAGLVEHWLADYYLAQIPLAGSAVSFAARTINSYWGTSQWVDLARFAGLQAHQEVPSGAPSNTANQNEARSLDSDFSIGNAAPMADDVRQTLESLVADDALSNALTGMEDAEIGQGDPKKGKTGLTVYMEGMEGEEKPLIPEFEELHRRLQMMESFMDASFVEGKKEIEGMKEVNSLTTTVTGHHPPVHTFVKSRDDQEK